MELFNSYTSTSHYERHLKFFKTVLPSGQTEGERIAIAVAHITGLDNYKGKWTDDSKMDAFMKNNSDEILRKPYLNINDKGRQVIDKKNGVKDNSTMRYWNNGEFSEMQFPAFFSQVRKPLNIAIEFDSETKTRKEIKKDLKLLHKFLCQAILVTSIQRMMINFPTSYTDRKTKEEIRIKKAVPFTMIGRNLPPVVKNGIPLGYLGPFVLWDNFVPLMGMSPNLRPKGKEEKIKQCLRNILGNSVTDFITNINTSSKQVQEVVVNTIATEGTNWQPIQFVNVGMLTLMSDKDKDSNLIKICHGKKSDFGIQGISMNGQVEANLASLCMSGAIFMSIEVMTKQIGLLVPTFRKEQLKYFPSYAGTNDMMGEIVMNYVPKKYIQSKGKGVTGQKVAATMKKGANTSMEFYEKAQLSLTSMFSRSMMTNLGASGNHKIEILNNSIVEMIDCDGKIISVKVNNVEFFLTTSGIRQKELDDEVIEKSLMGVDTKSRKRKMEGGKEEEAGAAKK